MTNLLTKRFKYLLILIVFGFALTGTECEKLLLNSGGIEGSWVMVKMEGNLQDVCLGEIAQFSNGTATLKCPGASAVTKSYTYENNVLTYTTSNVKYNVSFTTQNGVDKMILTAVGIQRVLTYDKNSK